MGRPRKPENERKGLLTIRVQQWLIDRLKKEKNYTSIIESFLINYFEKKD